MSDDPTLQRGCSPPYDNPYRADPSRYHYVIIDVFSMAESAGDVKTITPGSYAVEADPPQGGGESLFGMVSESGPAVGASGYYAVSGTVQLTGVGSVVGGSFAATDFQAGAFGSMNPQSMGDLSGAFVARPCPPLLMTWSWNQEYPPCTPCSHGPGG
jgi:hypothetical protein